MSHKEDLVARFCFFCDAHACRFGFTLKLRAHQLAEVFSVFNGDRSPTRGGWSRGTVNFEMLLRVVCVDVAETKILSLVSARALSVRFSF